MTPLQRIAMGLVIVLVDALFGGYDAVPDPLGWVLVIAGVIPLRDRFDHGAALLATAWIALAASAATYLPQVSGALDESGGWALSLPQLAFSFLLCTAVAPAAGWAAGRFNLLRWVFAFLAAGPVLVFGGGVDALRDPLAFVIVGANVYLVYLLFQVSREVAPAVGKA